MNSLFRAYFSALLPRASSIIVRGVYYGHSAAPSWKTNFKYVDDGGTNLRFLFTRIRCQCYSTKSSNKKKQSKAKAKSVMKDDKGKSLSDCQAQVGNSVLDPPISVYKGHAMRKDAEKHLQSCGLKNALYAGKIATSEVSQEVFHVRLFNLPKKKNIHKDLDSAFKGVAGILQIAPVVSGNKKTREPICKGLAYIDFRTGTEAHRFVQMFTGQSISFGKVQEQITCKMSGSSLKSLNEPSAEPVFTAQPEVCRVNNMGQTRSTRFDTEGDLVPKYDDEVLEEDHSLPLLNGGGPAKRKNASSIKSPSSKKKKGTQEKEIRVPSKTKKGRKPKLNIPGSANRLKIRETAALVGMFSKVTSRKEILTSLSVSVLKASSLHRGGAPSWITNFQYVDNRATNLRFLFTRIRCQCYSTKSSNKKKQSKAKAKPVMKDDKEAFFVVRKGDIVGVYKSLSDCQAQVGNSVCDPPVSVYKGQAMRKDAEKHLQSCGLKNALYTVKAEDLTEGIFGTLVPCPYQLPASVGETSTQLVSRKRPHEALWSASGLPASVGETSTQLVSRKRPHEALWSASGRSCTIEFDGASKGNPGQAGAGVVLRADDGSLVMKLREGLGTATCNAAEYRAIILGLRYALDKGFTNIRVRGDSKLVCMQIQGLWKVKNQNISLLYEEAKRLKDQFSSFQVIHVLRDLNSEADQQANLAVDLAVGQVQEEIDK
ncbi:OLC1v1028185C2 [Oldenlandia corymbosa var. corymbosa]|uniref:OLC1v1028185C2 n=1 Tax=Oldenlandia corymbosa var. corymbosa TaxID=529605 RepID=A0AAV1CCZ0_OLDCO|nr:OLC1v1028185C2 [Oldenlandia corymbosa var. corymbosa]